MKKHIVLCFDKNYTTPVIVLLKSLELSNKNDLFEIHIISPDAENVNFQNTILTQNLNNFTYHFYNANQELLKDCPVRKGDYINISTYYRILLPSILPDDIETVLYLDSDMLVTGNICSLWEINLNNKAAAVVPDIHYANPSEYSRLGISDSTQGYFNAGFMLINLKYWRENNIQNKTLSYIFNYPDRCKKHDQDALNYTLHNNLLYISHKYNYQRIFFCNYFNIPDCLKNDVIQSAYEPVIIHYCDLEKPWHYECFHPLKDIWIEIAKTIPTLNFNLSFKYKGLQKIKFILRKILESLKIKKPVIISNKIDFLKLITNINNNLGL